jgi:rubrerythrin
MANNRDDFNKEIVRTLQERVGNRCSNPKCRCPTSGPNHAPEKATRIGVAAHITAAAAGGPRYDSTLTAEQRGSIHNGVWLCQNCSKLVDSDPKIYPVEILIEWRQAAEDRAREELEGIQEPLPACPQNGDGWICPLCGTVVEHGRTVCLGCHAEVVYGTTRLEWQNAVKVGLMVGGIASGLLVFFLPGWLASSLSWNTVPGWGFGIYSVIPVAAPALLTGYVFARHEDKQRRLEAPRFFRLSVA